MRAAGRCGIGFSVINLAALAQISGSLSINHSFKWDCEVEAMPSLRIRFFDDLLESHLARGL